MSEKVGLMFATSGEYEDYRARPCEVYASVDAAQAEADRRNVLVIAAREKFRTTWDMPDEEFDATERKQNRIRNKLRRECADPDIEGHDIGDLVYTVSEARLIR